jgi:Domain of unknown function (DUF397)
VSVTPAGPGDLPWRKSSFSSMNGCVEVAPLGGGHLALRDSKSPDRGYFVYNAHEWHSFAAGVRAGEFDDLV